MAGYTHSEALQSSISKLSIDSTHEASAIEAMEDALAEEFERQSSGGSIDPRVAFKDAPVVEDSPDLLEALQNAEAEALEFERQESGFDDDRIEEIRDSVAHARSASDVQQQEKAKTDLPAARSIVGAQTVESCEAASPKLQSSPVLEALHDAYAEEVEFQRFVSNGSDDFEPLPCRVTMLEDSIVSESTAGADKDSLYILKEQREKEKLAPKAPQYMFSQPGMCDSVAAMEEAAAEAAEFMRQASGESEGQLDSLHESVSKMKEVV